MINRRQVKQLVEYMELMDDQGCVSVSEWVSGKGRFSSPKALPPFVTRFERGDRQEGKLAQAAQDYFERYPRRKAVLVLDKAQTDDALTELVNKGKEQ